MADNFHEGDRSDSENPSHQHYDSGVDLISSLPDEIIQHILSFIETKFAIRTSVLSRRWSHICWGTPSLYFHCDSSISTPELISKTLIRYTAAKFFSIHIGRSSAIDNTVKLDTWIEFAMSRKAEKLFLDFLFVGSYKYTFPNFFYSSSSLKQLSLYLGNCFMTPTICSVSWTSLKNLSLEYCQLPDESAVQILSGCPVLESLRLTSCQQLEFLDLSKLLLLRRLDITFYDWDTGSTVIIAPQIHYLKLIHCEEASTLVDVSSLIEADLSFWELSRRSLTTLVDFQNMLAKLHNVKKLTLESSFLQILSYAEHSGITFPTLKVETLTLEINIFKSVLTGLTKLLQNSPELKKITVHIRKITTSWRLFNQLDSEGLNEYQLWRVKDGIFQTPMDTIPTLMDMEAEAKFVLWLVESLLGNTKTVKTLIVVLLGSQVSERGFIELLQMVPTLDNKVSIVLKRSDD